MMLLPPQPGTCPECAVVHEPEMPHDKQSLYYQTQFYLRHGRWPTWEDAVAHCSDEMKWLWREELRAFDHAVKRDD